MMVHFIVCVTEPDPLLFKPSKVPFLLFVVVYFISTIADTIGDNR